MTTGTKTIWQSVTTDFGYRYQSQVSTPSWPNLLGQSTFPIYAFLAKKGETVYIGSGIHRQFSDTAAYLGKVHEPLFLQMDYECHKGPQAILSKYLIRITNGQATLDIYADTPMTADQCQDIYTGLYTHEEDPSIRLSNEIHRPTQDEWTNTVLLAQSEIRNDQLQKVVLSRQSSFKKSIHPTGFPLYQGFAAQLVDSNSYHYFYRDSDRTILGHSPEALFRANGECVSVDVVAGTRDSLEKDSLLDSHKDVNEHAIVLDEIHAILSHYGDVDKTEKTELSLGALTHLYQCVMAQIPAIHWAEVIMALHPTPAIGGSPKTMASTMITRLEAITRGWYGGLFGVSIDTTIDLAVTIRGVVVTDDACVTHVGAGIVAASDPAQEWEELNRKQHSILSVLGHTNTEFFS